MSPLRRSPTPMVAKDTSDNCDLELAQTQSIDSTDSSYNSPPATFHVTTPSNSVRSTRVTAMNELSMDLREVTSPASHHYSSVKKQTREKTSAAKSREPTLFQKCMAEAIGTAILVHFGCGAVCAALYTEALVGLGQATTIWSLGAALALYCTASTSGGHLNPAVTLSFALVRRQDFSCKLVLPYWGAQVAGAMAGAFLNYALFFEAIYTYEQANGITRGTNSVNSARGFGVYPSNVNSAFHAFFCEAFGAGMLTFIIFCVTHPKNKNAVPSAAIPAIVGAAIGSIIAILGSICGGGINPARDLGPRLVTAMLGWKLDSFAFIGASLCGPMVGGPIGAMLADNLFLRPEPALPHVKLMD